MVVSNSSKLPPFLTSLLKELSTLLFPILPPDIHTLLFPSPSPSMKPKARQVIINTYLPGEGITPHIDLLDRYDDGIIGVSLGSGCVMQFEHVGKDLAQSRSGYHPNGDPETNGDKEDYGVYLPPGSVYVMTKESRYEWTHGIERVMEDFVLGGEDEGPHKDGGRWIDRNFRVSITFRWLLDGADVVGGPSNSTSEV